MSIRRVVAWGLAALLLGPAAAPTRAAEPGIALVSMERLFDEYHKTKAANLKLKARYDEVDGRRRELLERAAALKAGVEARGEEARDKSISDAERERRRAAAEDAYAEYRKADAALVEFDTELKKKFGDQMKLTQQQLVGEIRAVVEAYARERGLRLVLDRSGKTLNSIESVVYADAALDITEAILALLNKHAPAGAPDTPPSGKPPP